MTENQAKYTINYQNITQNAQKETENMTKQQEITQNTQKPTVNEQSESVDSLYQKVKEIITESDFKSLVSNKLQILSGLVDEIGAARIVVSEIETNAQMKTQNTQTPQQQRQIEKEDTKIKDLQVRTFNCNLFAKVVNILDTRTFTSQKTGQPGKVKNVILGDETGKITLTLWYDSCKLFEEDGEFKVGDNLYITNAYTQFSDFNKTYDLLLSKESTVLKTEKQINYVPPIMTFKSLVHEPFRPEYDISLKCTITGLGPIRDFQRVDGSRGSVMNVELRDNAGDVMFMSVWDDMAESLYKIKLLPAEAEIHGAYTRLETYGNNSEVVLRLSKDGSFTWTE